MEKENIKIEDPIDSQVVSVTKVDVSDLGDNEEVSVGGSKSRMRLMGKKDDKGGQNKQVVRPSVEIEDEVGDDLPGLDESSLLSSMNIGKKEVVKKPEVVTEDGVKLQGKSFKALNIEDVEDDFEDEDDGDLDVDGMFGFLEKKSKKKVSVDVTKKEDLLKEDIQEVEDIREVVDIKKEEKVEVISVLNRSELVDVLKSVVGGEVYGVIEVPVVDFGDLGSFGYTSSYLGDVEINVLSSYVEGHDGTYILGPVPSVYVGGESRPVRFLRNNVVVGDDVAYILDAMLVEMLDSVHILVYGVKEFGLFKYGNYGVRGVSV